MPGLPRCIDTDGLWEQVDKIDPYPTRSRPGRVLVSRLSQVATEGFYCVAGFMQRRIIQRISNTNIRAQSERAAMHNGHIRFIEQRVGDIFIRVQYSSTR